MKTFLSKTFKGIISEKEFSPDWKKILGICFTVLAIVFGSLWYVSSGTGTFLRIMNWPWHSEWVDHAFSSKLKFQFPGFLNSLWGLSLCFPIYLRNFIPFKTLSPYSYISFALNFSLFSVVAQLIFGASGTFTHNTLNAVFLASLVISWLGIRSVAGFGWLAVFLLAVINLISADYHLKHFGYLFLLCAFSSFMFQSSFSPKHLFSNILEEFRGLGKGKGVFIRETMAEAATKTGKAIKTGTKLVSGK